MVREIALKILRYGGFCFQSDRLTFQRDADFSRRIQTNVPHREFEIDGGMLGRMDDARFVGQGLRPGEIRYVTNPPTSGHTLLISINGYLASIRGGNYLDRNREIIFAEPVEAFARPTERKRFKELSPSFDQTTDDEAVRVFWHVGSDANKVGHSSSTYAGILLPWSDCKALFNMVQNDPNDLQVLLATLFPVYLWLYPNLNLGQIEIKPPDCKPPKESSRQKTFKPVSYSELVGGRTSHGEETTNSIKYIPKTEIIPINIII